MQNGTIKKFVIKIEDLKTVYTRHYREKPARKKNTLSMSLHSAHASNNKSAMGNQKENGKLLSLFGNALLCKFYMREFPMTFWKRDGT